MTQSLNFDGTMEVPPTPTTSTSSNNTSTTSFTDTLHTYLTEKDGNKYYKGFRRTFTSSSSPFCTNDDETTPRNIGREQMFWIGDFIQFNIIVSPNEPPTIHEGKITSIYSCTFMGNLKKCKVQMLKSHDDVKSMMGIVGEDLMKKKDEFRRYMTDLEGEIPLSAITGRVFIVRDAKELKQRCGYYVDNDQQVNTIDNDCYIDKLSNPLSSASSSTTATGGSSNSQQHANLDGGEPVTFSWAMKDFKSPPSNHYDYYTSCIIGSGASLLMLSVGNVCQLEVKQSLSPSSQQQQSSTSTGSNSISTSSNSSSKIVMGRVSKMFEDKSITSSTNSSSKQQFLSIEEISPHKKTGSLTFTGCVKNIPVTDILSIKKQL